MTWTFSAASSASPASSPCLTICSARRDLDAAASAASAEAEVAKEQVIQALGDAEAGLCSGTPATAEVQRRAGAASPLAATAAPLQGGTDQWA